MAVMYGIGFYLRARKTEKSKKSFVIYMVIAFIVILGITLTLELLYKDNTFCHNLKRVALMSVLAPVAYIDFKELKIPNEYVLLGIIYWVLTIPLEIFKYNKYVLEDIKSSLVANLVFLFLALALCKICIKRLYRGRRYKTVCCDGAFVGVRGIWGSDVSVAYSVFLCHNIFLITKKKSKKMRWHLDRHLQ